MGVGIYLYESWGEHFGEVSELTQHEEGDPCPQCGRSLFIPSRPIYDDGMQEVSPVVCVDECGYISL